MHLIRDCVVSASSGCHRYPYWNEQFLFDGRDDTGWCTPSRSNPATEYLEIELPKPVTVQEIRMLSRQINSDAGFPKRIVAKTLEGDRWVPFWEQYDIQNKPNKWHAWALRSPVASRIRLEFSEVARRPEGKYFLQFMQLQLLSSEEG